MRNLIRISGLLVVLFSPNLTAKQIDNNKLLGLTQATLHTTHRLDEENRPRRRRRAEYRQAAQSARELSIEANDLARRLRYNNGRYAARQLSVDAKRLYRDIVYAQDSRRSNRYRLQSSYRDVRRSFRRLRRQIENRRRLYHVRRAYQDLTDIMDRILY